MNELCFELIKNLPNISAVYAIFNTDNICLYVGSSVAIKRRLVYHNKKKEFKDNNAAVIKWYPEKVENLVYLEIEKIKELNPSLNNIANRTPHKKRLDYKNNETISLKDITFNLLNKLTAYTTLNEVSEATNLPLHWLRTFSRNKCLDPSISRVEILYKFLSNSELSFINDKQIYSIFVKDKKAVHILNKKAN